MLSRRGHGYTALHTFYHLCRLKVDVSGAKRCTKYIKRHSIWIYRSIKIRYWGAWPSSGAVRRCAYWAAKTLSRACGLLEDPAPWLEVSSISARLRCANRKCGCLLWLSPPQLPGQLGTWSATGWLPLGHIVVGEAVPNQPPVLYVRWPNNSRMCTVGCGSGNPSYCAAEFPV